MRLPRRVPWQNLSELDELCSWIYSAQADYKLFAKNRLCAWQVNTPLPHALESVLSFLDAIILESSNPSSTTLRQLYALAVIRFVNGLVDPLQQSVYARPIYSLAAQIGLPAWIVELRHRSTHEDLPSLEVLREATRESMDWLLNRYFLPIISPSVSLTDNFDLPPLDPILTMYKSVVKSGLKDASLQGRNKVEVERLMKDIMAWISNVSALYATESSVRGADTAMSVQRTKLATMRFCERLCDKGGLVPVSKSKRLQPGKATEAPPNEAIWAPLIHYLDQQNEYFIDELLACALSILNDDESAENDPTFLATIASWVIWLVNASEDDAWRSESVKIMLNGAGPEGGNSIVRATVNSLIAQDPTFSNAVSNLRVVVKLRSKAQWNTDSMTLLEGRQLKLQEVLQSRPERDTKIESTQTVVHSGEEQQLPVGWIQVTQSSWVPCPIGAPIAS